jgi:hypothetical protein
MTAPRLTSSGQVEIVSHATMDGRLELFGYGQREDIPNPGDLMIVTTNWIRENYKTQEVEFKLRIRGKDMEIFSEAAKQALTLWNDNKHWLQASASQVGLNMTAMSAQRAQANRDALNLFTRNK